MKYLILGANGLIGRQFMTLCQGKKIDYAGTRFSREAGGLIKFDQLDLEAAPRVFDEVQPTVVINAIGLAGGVNFCEENPEISKKYHVEAVNVMADWCKRNNAAYGFISTDYVFDGQNPPYKETDQTNPLNLYGKYKLEAEHIIQAQLEKYVIARTTNVFGWDPETKTPNFLMHLINTLKTSDSIKVPSFLSGNPTYAGDLAAATMDLMQNGNFGLYHVVGPGYINRYDWALKCLEAAKITGKTIENMTEPPQCMVPRPLTSNLDTTKFNSKSNVKMRNVDEGLQLFARQFLASSQQL